MKDAELFRVIEALLRECPPSLFRDQLVDVLKANPEVLAVDRLATLSGRLVP